MKLLLVIEDIVTRKLLNNQLKVVPGISTILESDTAEDALFQILEKKPNLIISSAILPGRGGFELANLLREINIRIPFIVFSSDSSLVIQAIHSNISGFLVYPFSSNELVNAINNALLETDDGKSDVVINRSQKTKIKIAKPDGFSLLDIEMLTHCIAEGAYTRLCFSNGTEEVSSYNLGKVEKVLKDYKFVRINRSTIINLHKIKEIDWKRGICIVETGFMKDEFRITKFCLKKLQENNII